MSKTGYDWKEVEIGDWDDLRLPANDRKSDFAEILRDLRTQRGSRIKLSLKDMMSSGRVIISLLLDASRLVEELANTECERFVRFGLYWKKSSRGRKVFFDGPYLHAESKCIGTGRWTSTYIAVANALSQKKIENKLGRIAMFDVHQPDLGRLMEIASIMNQVAVGRSAVERLAKLYEIKLNQEMQPSWESLVERIAYALDELQIRIRSEHEGLIARETDLDDQILRFNIAMKERYRRIYFKWNINPGKRLSPMGPTGVEPYIVTRKSGKARFSKPLRQFKRKLLQEEKGEPIKLADVTPWVTNRVLRLGRATTLRKKLLGIQENIKCQLKDWELNYKRLLITVSNTDKMTYLSNKN